MASLGLLSKKGQTMAKKRRNPGTRIPPIKAPLMDILPILMVVMAINS